MFTVGNNNKEVIDVDIEEKENDDLFLDLIKERPCLYNKQLSDHNDKLVFENSMEEIAFIMQDTVQNCEKCWNRLKARYMKERLLEESESRSGSAASKRQKWIFYDRMKSLLSNNISRKSYTNLPSSKGKTNSLPVGRRTKKKNENTVIAAFSNVNAAVNTVRAALEAPKSQGSISNDPDEILGKLVAAELRLLSPVTVKKKKKMLLKALLDSEDSDDE